MRFSIRCITVLPILLLILHTAVRSQTLTVERDRVFASYGVVVARSFPLFPLQTGVGKVFEQVIPEPGTTSMRLHFQIQSAPQAPSWAVRIVDVSRALLWSYSAPPTGTTEFWSSDLPSDRVIVEVFSVQEKSPLKLLIDRVAISAPPITPTSITLPDQRANIDSQSAEIRAWGRSVARLRFVGDDGRQYVCTGFLVSQDLLLTNHHCIKSNSEMASALVDFDYDSSAAAPITLRLRDLVTKDQELDFALLRLSEPSGRPPLRLESAEPGQQGLVIIQHPGGSPKQVSILDCRPANQEVSGISSRLTDFGHLCDTLGGSSGSPVQVLTSGNVIGLHHLGFRPGSDKLFNQAVKIGQIIQFLRDNASSLLGEIGIH